MSATVDTQIDHSPAARAARGKDARSEAPRSSHAGWTAPPRRRNPITVLTSQARSRVPELVPIRYGRMGRTPFTFFRGAAAVMAGDLASTPASGLRAQLCGDAHLSNFGGFASPEREMLFDINDFDETLPGPWEWDVKRLAASVQIAGHDRSFDAAACRDAVLTTVSSYREGMRSLAEMTNLEVWYARLDADRILELVRDRGRGAKQARAVEGRIEKARGKDSRRAAGKLTRTVDGQLRFVSEPPLIVPLQELLPDAERRQFEEGIVGLLGDYRDSLQEDRHALLDSYTFHDIARKVVGVGSVGTRAWIVLMSGRDEQDPLVLQCKEAQASVLEPHAGPSRYPNSGQRVVEGQRLMQAASDIFLGWLPAVGLDEQPRDFYVRQLWDGKLSVDVDTMEADQLRLYGGVCGWTLARAHARSGDRIAIAGYLGKSAVVDEAIADFAAAYAEQNERDHQALLDAIGSGRIQAEDA